MSFSADSYSRVAHPRVSYGKPSNLKKVIVGNVVFELTEEELRSEPDNLLLKLIRPTHYSNSEPHISADPNIFRLLHAHLQGYEILPLPPQGIPVGQHGSSTIGSEAALANLLRDANDFGLKNLVGKIEKEMAVPSRKVTSPEGQLKRYRLIITGERGLMSNEGVYITEATKEAIILRLMGEDVEIVGPDVPIPEGYRVLVAWREYSTFETGGREVVKRKGFILLESV